MNILSNWYNALITGLIFLGVGVLMIASPAVSYISLSIIFTISFLSSGILDITFSINNRASLDGWMWIFLSGLLSVIISIVLMIHPSMSLIILPIYIAFAILLRSILTIAFSTQMGSGSGAITFMGVVGVILSILMLLNPMFAGISIVYLTAFSFISIGLMSTIFSFQLKKLNNFN